MLRVRTVLTGVAGAPWYTNMFFVGNSQIEAEDCRDTVLAFWNGIDDLMANTVTFTLDPGVANINEATGVVSGMFTTAGGTGAGDSFGDPLPRANQALVQWRTGVYNGSREIRGRTFIPGLTEVSATDGKVAAATKTQLQTAADALIAGGTSAAQLAVWARPQPEATPPRVGQAPAVVSAGIWEQWAVLRSRRD